MTKGKRRCKTCKFFVLLCHLPDESWRDHFGVCDNSKLERLDYQEFDAAVLLGPEDNCSLRVGEDFGCIHWERDVRSGRR